MWISRDRKVGIGIYIYIVCVCVWEREREKERERERDVNRLIDRLIPIVIGALGTITNELLKGLKNQRTSRDYLEGCPYATFTATLLWEGVKRAFFFFFRMKKLLHCSSFQIGRGPVSLAPKFKFLTCPLPVTYWLHEKFFKSHTLVWSFLALAAGFLVNELL